MVEDFFYGRAPGCSTDKDSLDEKFGGVFHCIHCSAVLSNNIQWDFSLWVDSLSLNKTLILVVLLFVLQVDGPHAATRLHVVSGRRTCWQCVHLSPLFPSLSVSVQLAEPHKRRSQPERLSRSTIITTDIFIIFSALLLWHAFIFDSY